LIFDIGNRLRLAFATFNLIALAVLASKSLPSTNNLISELKISGVNRVEYNLENPDEQIKHQFHLRNETGVPFEITDFTSDCSCVSVKLPERQLVEIGEHFTISVAVNRVRENFSNYDQRITIRTSLGTHPLSIYGHVRQNERIRVRPTAVVLGDGNDPVILSVLYPKTKSIHSIVTDAGDTFAFSMQTSHDDTMNLSTVDVSALRRTTNVAKKIIVDFATNQIEIPVRFTN
jgi:hypothetical protein